MCLFAYSIEACGGAKHSRDQDVTDQKEQQKMSGLGGVGHTDSRVEGQNRRGRAEITDVGKNESNGLTQRVRKMDTSTNSQSRKE